MGLESPVRQVLVHVCVAVHASMGAGVVGPYISANHTPASLPGRVYLGLSGLVGEEFVE